MMSNGCIDVNIKAMALMELVDAPLLIVSPDFTIVGVNDRTLALLELNRDEVRGASVFSFFNDLDSQLLRNTFAGITVNMGSVFESSIGTSSRAKHLVRWSIQKSCNLFDGMHVFVLTGRDVFRQDYGIITQKDRNLTISNGLFSLINLISTYTSGNPFKKSSAKFLAQDMGSLFGEIVSLLPGAVYWQDRNCVYLGCNDEAVAPVGFSSHADLIGRTDFDLQKMMGVKWPEKLAASFNKSAEMVMSTGQPLINCKQESFMHIDGKTKIENLTNKIALKDRYGYVVGNLGISINICDPNSQIALQRAIVNIKSILLEKEKDVLRYNVITDRELECLAHIARGETSKIVGRKMGISYRTVESYLQKLRGKFNCCSKGELCKLFWSTELKQRAKEAGYYQEI